MVTTHVALGWHWFWRVLLEKLNCLTKNTTVSFAEIAKDAIKSAFEDDELMAGLTEVKDAFTDFYSDLQAARAEDAQASIDASNERIAGLQSELDKETEAKVEWSPEFPAPVCID